MKTKTKKDVLIKKESTLEIEMKRIGSVAKYILTEIDLLEEIVDTKLYEIIQEEKDLSLSYVESVDPFHMVHFQEEPVLHILKNEVYKLHSGIELEHEDQAICYLYKILTNCNEDNN